MWIFVASLPKIIVQICGDADTIVLPVRSAYKVVSGDENTVFEPVNL
jgi:hypothetical protein